MVVTQFMHITQVCPKMSRQFFVQWLSMRLSMGLCKPRPNCWTLEHTSNSNLDITDILIYVIIQICIKCSCQPHCCCRHPWKYFKAYDTIRDAILTWARKPTWVGLIYSTQTTTKNCKTEKLKSKNSLTVKSLGESCSQSWRRKRKAAARKICRKRRHSLNAR